jgi:hypothetical protein
MTSAHHSPKGQGGQRPHTRIEEFSDKCKLGKAARYLVLEVNRRVADKFTTYSELVRHLGTLKYKPRWVRLDDEGNPTTNASSYCSSRFGRGSKYLATWQDFELILQECDAMDRMPVIASLWEAAHGYRHPTYKGKFADISSILNTAEASTKKESDADGSTVNLASYAAENEKLKATIEALKRQVDIQSRLLETQLRSRSVQIPKPCYANEIDHQIKHNNRLIELLTTSQDAQAANGIRKRFGSRLYLSESRVRELWERLRNDQEASDRSTHIAAALLTLATRSTAIDNWYRPDHFHALRLPYDMWASFAPREFVRRSGDGPTDRHLAFYLKTYLSLRHGGSLEVNSGDELTQLIENGVLPSAEVLQDFFSAEEDFDRLNAVLSLLDVERDRDVRPPLRFVDAPKRHRDQDWDPRDDLALTMIMPAWRTSA